MALKDWKELKKDFWRNFKKPFDMLIYKRGLKQYAVQIGSRVSLYNFSRTLFKTRQQALRFAKEYMRTH